MTPDQRHAIETQPADNKIAEVAESLVARWTSATARIEVLDRIAYRAAVAVPSTTSGLSPADTSRAVVLAISNMRGAGWQVDAQRAVITIVGYPTE